MLNPNKTIQHGFGLVEFMVAVAVGFVVILASGSVYLTTLYSSNDTTRLTRLNQDMRTILDIMVQDIHRAGQWGGAAQGVGNNPFSSRTSGSGTDIFISADNKCILYSYDVNQDGVVAADGSEFFGFRFNEDAKQVEVLNETGSPDTSGDCSGLSWLPLNSPSEVIITALTFSTEKSRCIAFNTTTFDIDDATTYSQWQLSGTNSAAACDTTTNSGTTSPVGTTVPAGVAFDSSILNGRSEVRQITIQLTAKSAKDSSFSRDQTETVRIRNDRVS